MRFDPPSRTLAPSPAPTDVHPAALQVNEKQHVIVNSPRRVSTSAVKKSVPTNSARWVRMNAAQVVVYLRLKPLAPASAASKICARLSLRATCLPALSVPGLRGLEPPDVVSTIFVAGRQAKGLRSHNVRRTKENYPVFQWLPKNDVCEFESYMPRHEFVDLAEFGVKCRCGNSGSFFNAGSPSAMVNGFRSAPMSNRWIGGRRRRNRRCGSAVSSMPLVAHHGRLPVRVLEPTW